MRGSAPGNRCVPDIRTPHWKSSPPMAFADWDHATGKIARFCNLYPNARLPSTITRPTSKHERTQKRFIQGYTCLTNGSGQTPDVQKICWFGTGPRHRRCLCPICRGFKDLTRAAWDFDVRTVTIEGLTSGRYLLPITVRIVAAIATCGRLLCRILMTPAALY